MGAAADFVGEADAADRAVLDVPRVDQDAFALLCAFVGDEADEVAVILSLAVQARREGRFAAEAVGASFGESGMGFCWW